ncbi:NUDIX domain-containing protein [Sphingobium sp. JS3065]|uniref:NUDIX domain-containing protein n=1 Tax=Sphingobium sp. JS3065 TaxID=2970925 RepID=UPI002265062D|nr:NUDIX domain-containing protein [Sphingobium sp. JS3065]UZW55487.1 NUDIX domain-containing protein [Sphingobium sp. JS3065]
MTEDVPESRAAATVVILRNRPRAAPEILMMERASSMAFAAGALVFPGGAVDESDHALAAKIAGGLPLDEAAARIAAIRETLEESGLAIAFTRPLETDRIAAMRRTLVEGAGLGDMLSAHGLEVALDALVPFARWHPARLERVRRVFDTRFYLVQAPEGQAASVDETENVQLFWSGAADTLARCDRGEGQIIFPTRRNLERLAQFGSFDDLAAHALSIPVEKVTPWQEERDGETHLCIPGHLGYPVTSEPIATARRA